MKTYVPNILCVGGLCLLLNAGSIFAQKIEPDSVYQSLHEVEVTANRLSDDITSSAPRYSLDQEQLRATGVTDLTEALHRLPGLNIRDYGGAGGMKTVSVRGFGTSHTGVVYDGVALSDAQSGMIDLSRYSLDNVDDMALVIGDNNDIFTTAKGASSAAGIFINTGSVPEANDSVWHFTGMLRVGSFGMINPYIKVGKSVTRHISLAAAGEFHHARNDYPFTLRNGKEVSRERRQNSLMNSGHGELNLRWRMTDKSALDAKLFYYDNDRQLPGPVVLYNSDSHDTLHDRNFFSQITYSNAGKEKFKFRGIAKFNFDATYYHEVNGKYAGGYRDENNIQREYYLSGGALYFPTEKFAVSYVADYFYNNLTSNSKTTVGPWRHTVLQALSARFSSEFIRVSGRLLCSSFISGVKVGESVPDRTKVSPSLSVSVKPWAERTIYLRASYKNIFRFPTFNESYYYHLGSLSLKPETTDQLNLGVTWQSGSYRVLTAFSLTADVYYNTIKDKIVAIPMNMYVWSMMNLDKVRAYGSDITLNSEIGIAYRQALLISGNYSWQRVQPRTSPKDPDYNKQVAYTPVHSGAASLTWQNPWVDVVLKITGAGERFGTNTNLPITRLKPYSEFGVSLMRKFDIRHSKLDIRLDALNLIDTQYEIVASYPMPGRSFRFSVSYEL